MYFIVNITRPPQEVYIKDLDFRLGPNKALDLEKVKSRFDIESSQDLKNCVKNRKIQLRQTSHSRAKPEDQPQPQKKGLDADDINKITDSVVERLKGSMSQSNVPDELVAVLKDLKNAMQQPQQVVHVTEKLNVPVSKPEDDDLDLDRLAEIHAKSVARKAKKTEGNIGYEEKNVEDQASSRADELGDLLG